MSGTDCPSAGYRRVMTERERLVLVDAAQGLSAQQSADRRGTTLFGVQHTLRTVKRALGALTIAHAVAIAITMGYISHEEITGGRS